MLHTTDIPRFWTTTKKALNAVYDVSRELERTIRDIWYGISRSTDGGNSWERCNSIGNGRMGGLPTKFNGVVTQNIDSGRTNGNNIRCGLWMQRCYQRARVWRKTWAKEQELNHCGRTKGSQQVWTLNRQCQFLIQSFNRYGRTWSEAIIWPNV